MASITEDQAVSLLYVEDEQDAREMVGRMLSTRYPAMRLLVAQHGAEGLELYRAHRPDLVVTDISMPVMDGIEMATEIKKLNPEVVIIAMTAFNDADYLISALEIGIRHYIMKPVNYDRLFEVVEEGAGTIALKRQVKVQQARIRKLSRAVESNPCSVMITDPQGRIEYVNPKFTEITGYSATEVMGQKPALLKSSETPPETFERLWGAIACGKEWHGEFRNRKKDGTVYWESALISPIFDEDGSITNFVSVHEDITDRKLLDEEIRTLNQRLEQKVHERTAHLEASIHELESFTYAVSHDLRAPLNRLEGFCEALKEDYADQLDEHGAFFVDSIHKMSQELRRIVDALLRLSRVTKAEVVPKAVDLSALVAGVAAELRKAHPEHDVRTIVAPGVQVMGDEPMLRQALVNLLGNAWKFTAEISGATIEFGVVRGEEPVYFVRDNGAGFDMKYAGQLFKPFHRLHASDEFPGEGIGLATAQRIIQCHGGRIWGEGEIGKGATFFFTLCPAAAGVHRQGEAV